MLKKISNSSNEQKKKEIVINVTTQEIILTPLSCASIINEIIKTLIYQKSQIPYSYNWLASVVNKRRKQEDNETITNLTAERHYKIVSSAYDALEALASNLGLVFKNCGKHIKQVIVLFGSNIYYPKEIYQINISGLAMDHLENNHVHTNTKNQHKILRKIMLAQEWLDAMDTVIPLTNMYVMLQKQQSADDGSDKNTFFEENPQYTMPSKSHLVKINLTFEEPTDSKCCNHLSIFEDGCKQSVKITNSVSIKDHDLEAVDNSHFSWYQANVDIKGFKDCFINKVSATELW